MKPSILITKKTKRKTKRKKKLTLFIFRYVFMKEVLYVLKMYPFVKKKLPSALVFYVPSAVAYFLSFNA